MSLSGYEGDYIIIGPPGCGKTTRLTRSVEKIVHRSKQWPSASKSPVLLCSLTRTAAAEIAGRNRMLHTNAAGTLHGHAYAALGAPAVAESKDNIEDWNERHKDYPITMADPDIEERSETGTGNARGDDLLAQYHLFRARMQDRSTWPPELLLFASRWEPWKTEIDAIDFSDMIEQAIPLAPPMRPEVIMADEAQDLSRLESTLLRSWGGKAGATILCGDPWQALYEWRGADHRILLNPDVPDYKRDILGQSYRCPAVAVKAAQSIARMLSDYAPIEYAPTDVEGSIEHTPATIRSPKPILDLIEDNLAAGQTTMLMASCEYMLAPILKALREAGIPFANPWRVKNGRWNPIRRTGNPIWQRLLDFLRPDFSTFDDASEWTVSQLRSWLEVCKAKGLLKHGLKKRLDEWPEDRLDLGIAHHTWGQWFEAQPASRLQQLFLDDGKTAELLDWFEAHLLASKRKPAQAPLQIARKRGPLALREEPKVFVGTIHSFKGAEADNTIIFPDLSPKGIREWNGLPERRDAILRLYYVALTRARRTITLCEAASGFAIPLRRIIHA